MRTVITFGTSSREELVDITEQVREIVFQHGAGYKLCALYALGATAAIIIQENRDPHIQTDVLECLRSIAPRGRWQHDQIDGYEDGHIKAGLVGPSETIPIEKG